MSRHPRSAFFLIIVLMAPRLMLRGSLGDGMVTFLVWGLVGLALLVRRPLLGVPRAVAISTRSCRGLGAHPCGGAADLSRATSRRSPACT